MSRLINLLLYEFKFTKFNWLFHLFALIFPILYLIIFSFMLDKDITLPVSLETPVTRQEAGLYQTMQELKTPDGISYWNVETAPREDSFIQYPQVLLDKNQDTVNFNIILNYQITNTNLIKNYRNRAVGGIINYLEKNYLGERAVNIREEPLYNSDIVWIGFMGMTIMVMGILISGIFVGGTALAGQIEQHAFAEYILSPLPDRVIIGTKLLALSLKTILITLVYITVFFLRCNILPAHPFGLLGIVTIFAVLTTAVGMIVGLLTGSTLLTFIIGLILSLGTWIIGGGFGTTSFYPGMIAWLNYLNPVYYMIKLAKSIYFLPYFSVWRAETFMLIGMTITLIYILFSIYRRAYRWGVE